LTLWWEHLLFGQPPPGLDVKLSLDLDLQTIADRQLAGDPGAVVLLNAHTGEILAMASSPSFDANQLGTTWQSLVNDPTSPLYDRAGMGLYPTGSLLGAFLLADRQPPATGQPGNVTLANCAFTPAGKSWGALLSAGCPGATFQLTNSMDNPDLLDLLDVLGLFTSPVFPVETLSSTRPDDISDGFSYITGTVDTVTGASLMVSPLQMALAASTLSNEGVRPSPRLVVAVDTPQSGWVMLPESSQPQQAFQAVAASNTAMALADPDLPIWQAVSNGRGGVGEPFAANPGYSWYIGGTLPEWQGVPLSIAVILEENNPRRALDLGQNLIQSAMHP
jgi:hypothetical protein